jgi:hypothetical protein
VRFKAALPEFDLTNINVNPECAMIEFDMMTGEFLDEDIAERGAGHWSPTAELYAELRLLTVEEAEAERQGRR